MRVNILMLILCFVLTNAQYDFDNGEVYAHELKCVVCRATVKEIENALGQIDPAHQIEVGSRIDAQGNMIKKKVPMIKSETHFSELLENVCVKLDDYVRARYKSNGKLTIFNLISPTGGMNPDMSKVKIVQDSDLNKSLRFTCEEIIVENEDYIASIFNKGSSDAVNQICTRSLGLCKDFDSDNQSDSENYDDYDSDHNDEL
ncbi:protein seele [Microplitis demolitor]|uniref:protein seele n=1 Tax=Microplitis demolitor TaxID=69319 RepID=UPI0004CCD45C|nr:protein seele [Microplitis demolitor]